MRRQQTAVLWFVLLAIILAAPMGYALSPLQTGLSNGVPWLQASGSYVYDGNGQRVDLYGVNVVIANGQKVTTSDLETIKSLGFNAFRVNDIFWGMVQPYNETLNGIDVQFFSTGVSAPLRGVHSPQTPLDSLVNMAVQEHMYIILCLSALDPYYIPPQWAFPSIPHTVWGQTNVITQAYAGIISGTAAKERTGIINTWRFIANRYKDIPNVMFELLNEPAVSDTSLAGTYYKTFNQQVISAIESVETQSHVKFVELLRDRYDQEITKGAMDISKANVVWATHHYFMSNWDPNGTYWHDSFTWHGKYFAAGNGNGTTYIAWRLIIVASTIHGWNRPWISTEIGKPVTAAFWKNWYSIVLSTMAEQQIAGWLFWCYSNPVLNYGGWDLATTTVRQQIMPILSPYLPSSSSTTSSPTTSSSTATTTKTNTTTTTTTKTNTTTTTTTKTNTTTTTTTTSWTSMNSMATSLPFQRKTFYQSGRFWVWYSDGTNMLFRTSIDGMTWTAATPVRHVFSGAYFSVFSDGIYVHYAYGNNGANSALFYRRGETNPDGTITWSTVEQTVVTAQACCGNTKPSIAVDSNGYPWIAYQWTNFTGTVTYVNKVTKPTANDGTWSTAIGFPYALTSSSAVTQMAGIIPLTGGKIGAISAVTEASIALQTWTGSAWRSAVYTASRLADCGSWSAVSQGDDIHLVFLKALPSQPITYVKYTYATNSFGSESTVQPTTTNNAAPVISISSSTNNLYIFWAGSPNANHIYYREFQASNMTWMPTLDWITEVALTRNDCLTTSYQASNNYIGLAYLNKTSSPYQIRFAYLSTVS